MDWVHISFLGSVNVVTPVRCFFRTRSPLPLHTRVNMVINYHISVRTGLISRWNGYPSVRCFFRTKLNVVLFPNGMGPYSFQGRVKLVPLRTMFIRTKWNVVNVYHISDRLGPFHSVWGECDSPFPLRMSFSILGWMYLINISPYDVSSVLGGAGSINELLLEG